MRIVLFGVGSPASIAAYKTLRSQGLVGVVVPGWNLRSARGLLKTLRWAWAARRFLGLLVRDRIRCHVYRRCDVDAAVRFLHRLKPDLLCASAFPYLLPRAVLDTARLGGLNVHPSALPAYPGKNPIRDAIAAGERVFGITIHWMDEGADTGLIIAQDSFEPSDPRDVLEIYALAVERGGSILGQVVDELASRPQTGAGNE